MSCLIPDCDGFGHPDQCTRTLGEVTVAGQLEFSTELVADDHGARWVSLLGLRTGLAEALLARARTRTELLALAGQFADVAALLEAAVDALPDEGECAWCERVWPVEDLAADGNGDPVCCDCRAGDTSSEDAAAYRAHALGR